MGVDRGSFAIHGQFGKSGGIDGCLARVEYRACTTGT
jgi:hypothetical protein